MLHYSVKNDKGQSYWNSHTEIPLNFADKYKITNDRAVMYRDYYTYLYGMPMKLKDKGTIVQKEIEQVSFYGNKYNRIKVTYQPEVGTDTWYFYFNLKTHALEACQFFKDEPKNDGEYILFEEIKEIQNIKIPRIRKWYFNDGEKYLGADILN